MYVQDNYDRWEAYEEAQIQKLESLPRCSECDEPIQTDYCYEINDELVCPDCMEQNYKKWTDDYCE